MQTSVMQILSETDTNLEEVILKQSKAGSRISLVVGENLFQVIRLNRKGELRHEFSIMRESVLGFRHRGFEGLHNIRLLLFILTLVSFVFITPITSTWSAPWFIIDIIFVVLLGLVLFTMGNPHVLTFNTQSGNYSVFFYQWGSRQQETVRAMSRLGIAMSTFLISREFKLPEVTYHIGHIGDNIGRVGDTIANDSVVMEDHSPTTEAE